MKVAVTEHAGATHADRVSTVLVLMKTMGVDLHDLSCCQPGIRLTKSVSTLAEPESPRMRALIDHVDARYASRKKKTLAALKTALGG